MSSYPRVSDGKRPSQLTAARLARDDGLRRVRKITWRVGLFAAASAAFIGAKFAHISAYLPHLPSSLSGSEGSSGSSSDGRSSSSGISSSSGVSSSSAGSAPVTSGGS